MKSNNFKIKIIYFSLDSPSSCQDSYQCGPFSICYLQNCHCKIGFEWSQTSSSCVQINCSKDSDCHLKTSHTTCANNKCSCAENYYLNSATQTCHFSLNPNSFSEFANILQFVGIGIIFMTFIIFGLVITRIIKNNKYKHFIDDQKINNK